MNIPPGKLPAPLLREFLHAVQKLDSSVLVGAAMGEDAAVIDVGASDLVVVASDPITFADADLGTHVLAVNGNDLAVMGAEPRWLLTTVLMPEGTVIDEVRTLMSGIDAACAAEKVTLVGGHTEVTRSVRSSLARCLGLLHRTSLFRRPVQNRLTCLSWPEGLRLRGQLSSRVITTAFFEQRVSIVTTSWRLRNG